MVKPSKVAPASEDRFNIASLEHQGHRSIAVNFTTSVTVAGAALVLNQIPVSLFLTLVLSPQLKQHLKKCGLSVTALDGMSIEI
jgi:hypothetical protein